MKKRFIKLKFKLSEKKIKFPYLHLIRFEILRNKREKKKKQERTRKQMQPIYL